MTGDWLMLGLVKTVSRIDPILKSKKKTMKKIKLSPVLAASVALAVQINHDVAHATPPPGTTVTYTNDIAYNSTNIFIPISPAIANADELIAISGGNVTGGESGSFTLTVDYSNSSHQVIDTVSGNLSFSLSTISYKTFTEGTIDGLTFVINNTFQPNWDKTSIPVGTIFTFQVVPEPATLAMAALGAGGLWLAARRRNGKQS